MLCAWTDAGISQHYDIAWLPWAAEHNMPNPVQPSPGPSLPSSPTAEEVLASADSLRDEPPSSFNDRVFDNEMNIAVAATKAAYDRLLFREALKKGW